MKVNGRPWMEGNNSGDATGDEPARIHELTVVATTTP